MQDQQPGSSARYAPDVNFDRADQRAVQCELQRFNIELQAINQSLVVRSSPEMARVARRIAQYNAYDAHRMFVRINTMLCQPKGSFVKHDSYGLESARHAKFFLALEELLECFTGDADCSAEPDKLLLFVSDGVLFEKRCEVLKSYGCWSLHDWLQFEVDRAAYLQKLVKKLHKILLCYARVIQPADEQFERSYVRELYAELGMLTWNNPLSLFLQFDGIATKFRLPGAFLSQVFGVPLFECSGVSNEVVSQFLRWRQKADLRSIGKILAADEYRY